MRVAIQRLVKVKKNVGVAVLMSPPQQIQAPKKMAAEEPHWYQGSYKNNKIVRHKHLREGFENYFCF